MKYEIINFEDGIAILRIDKNGKTWSIPQDPANSDYAEYLRYTAWVEAGNNPEDFWTQDEELEPSEPKEEEETPQETEGES